ncbi:MAG: DUF1294 domain-containing protein [Clostridia bacterium]|nr:DUF1294 domain-containing protein [Clostridia bacterium]
MFYWILIINAVAFVTAGIDKYLAKKNKRRISESTLFTIALAGGAVGEYVSMKLFHHKTLHKRFMIGLPVIIAVQLILLYLYRGLWL